MSEVQYTNNQCHKFRIKCHNRPGTQLHTALATSTICLITAAELYMLASCQNFELQLVSVFPRSLEMIVCMYVYVGSKSHWGRKVTGF